ncbi:MAG: response regulator [Candidatus Scalindua sp.]|mgnify:FL=1|jgi:DNA-binding response OmpR family regulator|nr:response regulator [Candidatus Scalindua sp.]MBT5307668.1 response regulator [Candidatus Scalindua sp.]MBT6230453.1 response regulator [Candidatus Scalindua sp.]MBT6563421.1 response regulator [Candidatus Scalindua sp.]MBT7212877.1 response regulator [Candidatus Scalindua sp.]
MLNMGRILIANNDDETLLLPIIDLLRLEGYECNYVPDTKTVIEILKCIKFDLLIADIDSVGSNAMGIIKELPDNAKEMSIILVADVPLSETQIQSLRTPVTACLSKPLCFEELLKPVKCSIKGKLIRT